MLVLNLEGKMSVGNGQKVVLVTGGGQGIGKGIAQKLLNEWMKVVIVDLDGEAVAETSEELGLSGAAFEVDVADERSVADLMGRINSSMGRLDALINNAGIAAHHVAAPERLELSDWNRVIATNLTGVFLCCKHAIPEMVKAGGGAIVSTASAAGLIGSNFHAYSASKGGMIALSRSIATTYAAQNIRSNVICPGFIDTPMVAEISSSPRLLQAYLDSTPLHRAGKPLDIAYMALYLASDEAAFVTGGVFVVDGGVTAR